MTTQIHATDVGGEDTDGWGEEEYDSCCAASNSSGVVIDRPPSLASPNNSNETLQIQDLAAKESSAAPVAPSEPLAHGVEGRSKGRNRKEGTGSGEVGEGDDSWEGWD